MDEYPVVHAPEGEILEEEEFERLYTASDHILVLLSIFYGSISILAVFGNTLVIWVVATTRQMRTVTNMYIANLAFADVIIGLFCIPFQFQAALLQTWYLPWFMCGFCPFMQALSVNVSVFTLTAIAVDRHRAIINPLRARPTKFISKIIISTIWLVSLIFAVPCAIAFRVELEHERIREDGITTNVTRPICTHNNLPGEQIRTYRYTLVFVQYLVPFCVISFVYIQMAIKLWGTQTPGNAQDTRDITLLRNKKKVIKMLIIVVIVFGLCWLPLQLYNILHVTIPEITEYHFIGMIWFFCDWLAMSNSCYNPFIYGIYNEKFKREFNKRFAACFCRFQTTLDQQDRTMSMHTRASSIRSTYANTSVRVRNSKHLSFNSYTLNTALASTPAAFSNYHVAQRHSTGASMRTLRPAKAAAAAAAASANGCGAVYNTITCMENVGSRGGGGDAHNASGQWRRNHFKPLYPDVIEHDDDLALMHVHSSSSASASAEQTPRHDNATLATTITTTTTATTTTTTTTRLPSASANCICEQQLGSRTACDGTCILSEVSRVHAPPTMAASSLAADNGALLANSIHSVVPKIAIAPLTTSTTTTTREAEDLLFARNGNANGAQQQQQRQRRYRTVDFDVASDAANALYDMETANEYTPLTTARGANAQP